MAESTVVLAVMLVVFVLTILACCVVNIRMERQKQALNSEIHRYVCVLLVCLWECVMRAVSQGMYATTVFL